MSERCDRTSERRSEWPSTQHVDFIAILPTVQRSIMHGDAKVTRIWTLACFLALALYIRGAVAPCGVVVSRRTTVNPFSYDNLYRAVERGDVDAVSTEI